MDSSPNALESFVFDPSAPLKDIIICCTSIPPDQRTEIANKVTELGGIHKYDLTPDVTHLIVGDYDTPKYRHVACERLDVRAMDVVWIDVLTELWKHDDEVDFLALEKEHQLKPLEKCGSDPSATSKSILQESVTSARQPLLICLTGFGERTDEIADMITKNGGQHTGDLTRKCSHLVVNAPQGKKYEAAISWSILAVTLDWLLQSIERGMILDETKFDPKLPPEKQGVGAWKRHDPKRSSLGKRTRSAATSTKDPAARKLRKTASMKLSSQRNSIFADIMGNSSRENSFVQQHADDKTQGAARPAPVREARRGIFADCIFFAHGFDRQRKDVIESTIGSMDGALVASLDDLYSESAATHRFLLVPQKSQPETHPVLPTNRSTAIHVVTEFYLEKCMHKKAYYDPSEEVLGRPFPLFPIHGFSDLCISTAAFTGREYLQVCRSIAQLGATFDEHFRAATSLVVCKSLPDMRREKLRLAIEWRVPVVSADWLWECISTGYNVPTADYEFPELKKRYYGTTPDDSKPQPTKARHVERTKSEPFPQSRRASRPPPEAGIDPTAFDGDSPDKKTKSSSRRLAPGDSTTSADFVTARTHLSIPAAAAGGAPLTALSSAALNQTAPPAATMLRTKSAPSVEIAKADAEAKTEAVKMAKVDAEARTEAVTAAQEAAVSERQSRAAERQAAERQSFRSKLSSLFDPADSAEPDPTGGAASDAPGTDDAGPPRPRRKQKILGRAVSNVSAASSGGDNAVAGKSRTVDPVVSGFLGGVEDRDGHSGDEEAAPPATQLGYSDPKAQEFKAAVMNQMMKSG